MNRIRVLSSIGGFTPGYTLWSGVTLLEYSYHHTPARCLVPWHHLMLQKCICILAETQRQCLSHLDSPCCFVVEYPVNIFLLFSTHSILNIRWPCHQQPEELMVPQGGAPWVKSVAVRMVLRRTNRNELSSPSLCCPGILCLLCPGSKGLSLPPHPLDLKRGGFDSWGSSPGICRNPGCVYRDSGW